MLRKAPSRVAQRRLVLVWTAPLQGGGVTVGLGRTGAVFKLKAAEAAALEASLQAQRLQTSEPAPAGQPIVELAAACAKPARPRGLPRRRKAGRR